MGGMRKFAVPLSIAGTLAIAVTLFHLKQRVGDLELELSQVNRDISAHRESIKVLRNEWGFLNRPARLAAQAKDLLKMATTPPSRLIRFEDLPRRSLNAGAVQSASRARAIPNLINKTAFALELNRNPGSVE